MDHRAPKLLHLEQQTKRRQVVLGHTAVGPPAPVEVMDAHGAVAKEHRQLCPVEVRLQRSLFDEVHGDRLVGEVQLLKGEKRGEGND